MANYRNDKYGFEFKYPTQLNLFESYNKAPTGTIHNVYFYNLNVEPAGTPDLFINIYNNSNNLSVEGWVGEHPESYHSDSHVFYKNKNQTEIDGIIGLYISEPNDLVPKEVIVLRKGNYMFVLGFFNSSSQIISTFKFIEPNQ